MLLLKGLKKSAAMDNRTLESSLKCTTEVHSRRSKYWQPLLWRLKGARERKKKPGGPIRRRDSMGRVRSRITLLRSQLGSDTKKSVFVANCKIERSGPLVRRKCGPKSRYFRWTAFSEWYVSSDPYLRFVNHFLYVIFLV